jgi:hypothetical protein
MDSVFKRAKTFIFTQARLLERLLFAVQFENAEPRKVGLLVSACQNADGGLGHALEPDLRSPCSQPLFIEIGLRAMHDAGCKDKALAFSFCSFLEKVSDQRGLVPPILANALESPHASHWGGPQPPSINPTAAICGLLIDQGVEHPWLARATETCCDILLNQPQDEAHGLVCAAVLADHLPDKQTAIRIEMMLGSKLEAARFFISAAPVREYGLTPLHFASSPESRWNNLFTKTQIREHLEDLQRRQMEDGGWPISWGPPGPASVCEWRGRWTLDAIKTLVAYGVVKR